MKEHYRKQKLILHYHLDNMIFVLLGYDEEEPFKLVEAIAFD